ncbi:uncharacterized protein LOC115417996 [Sphaeramia orbicularis]|uniref:uncharacterized protein LOC115417996 n=1 Tax=Sphaeramia orbicularis TaxID=375764 RepID=UPI001180672F|nr:uncharacterized protein LOC115417996 [Sphaeramia orbicularis]
MCKPLFANTADPRTLQRIVTDPVNERLDPDSTVSYPGTLRVPLATGGDKTVTGTERAPELEWKLWTGGTRPLSSGDKDNRIRTHLLGFALTQGVQPEQEIHSTSWTSIHLKRGTLKVLQVLRVLRCSQGCGPLCRPGPYLAGPQAGRGGVQEGRGGAVARPAGAHVQEVRRADAAVAPGERRGLAGLAALRVLPERGAEPGPAVAEAEPGPAVAEAEPGPAVAEAEPGPAVAEAEGGPSVAEAAHAGVRQRVPCCHLHLDRRLELQQSKAQRAESVVSQFEQDPNYASDAELLAATENILEESEAAVCTQLTTCVELTPAGSQDTEPRPSSPEESSAASEPGGVVLEGWQKFWEQPPASAKAPGIATPNIGWLKGSEMHGLFTRASSYKSVRGETVERRLLKEQMEFHPPPPPSSVRGALPNMLAFFATPKRKE